MTRKLPGGCTLIRNFSLAEKDPLVPLTSRMACPSWEHSAFQPYFVPWKRVFALLTPPHCLTPFLLALSAMIEAVDSARTNSSPIHQLSHPLNHQLCLLHPKLLPTPSSQALFLLSPLCQALLLPANQVLVQLQPASCWALFPEPSRKTPITMTSVIQRCPV